MNFGQSVLSNTPLGRRAFMTFVGGALASVPISAFAQEMPLVGVLIGLSNDAEFRHVSRRSQAVSQSKAGRWERLYGLSIGFLKATSSEWRRSQKNSPHLGLTAFSATAPLLSAH